jgi:hypothetical protein
MVVPPPRWAGAIPEEGRAAAARALARSIREAHALHAGCWTVTLGNGFVRLNVGVPLALTLSDECQLIVMRDAPEIRELGQLGVEARGGFVKAPGTVCVSFPLRSLEAVHRRLWSSHAAALRVAVGKQGATPHTGYSHELIAYLRSQEFDLPDSECAGALKVRRALGEKISAKDVFDPRHPPDGREYDRRAILRRQGQPAFRLALLRAYDGKCAVTGCGVVEVLQAAHIIPYRGPATDRVENGLLLRSDIHDLFDLGKLDFDDEWRVRLHDDLRGSLYEELEGRTVRLPRNERLRPSLEAVRARREAI